MKIAVYAIAKNEAANVVAWRRSAAAADYLILADTGSTDGTRRVARDLCDGCFSISISPWRFDDARNAALALVPADADICVPLDLDERLSDGWRDALEAAWTPGTTKASYLYTWAEGAEPFWQNRIHARHGYRWRYPTHEGVYPYFEHDERAVLVPGLHIRQFQDKTKARPNDLHLLAWGEFENPGDPRMLFYYGRELWFWGYRRQAAEKFEQYLRSGRTLGWEVDQIRALLGGKAQRVE